MNNRLLVQANTIHVQQKQINTLRIDFERAHNSIQALKHMYALLLSYVAQNDLETAQKEAHLEAFGNLLDRAAEDMENSYAMSMEVAV